MVLRSRLRRLDLTSLVLGALSYADATTRAQPTPRAAKAGTSAADGPNCSARGPAIAVSGVNFWRDDRDTLRELSAGNFGYFPDDFSGNRPDIESIDAAISLQTVPV